MKFDWNMGLATQRLEKEFKDLGICLSLLRCIFTDFGGLDMCYACLTAAFLEKPYLPNAVVAGTGSKNVST